MNVHCKNDNTIFSHGDSVTYIDGSRAVYRLSLSFVGPQMNRLQQYRVVLMGTGSAGPGFGLYLDII